MLLKSHWKESDFCVRILYFLRCAGASSPESLYSPSTELLAFVFGGRPSNFRKKLKLQEENLGKIHKNQPKNPA